MSFNKKSYFLIFYLILLPLFFISSLKMTGQTVNILISTPVTGYPTTTVVNQSYTNAGFSNVNIISGNITNALTTSNYDVLIVTEFYQSVSSVYSPFFITNVQRTIVENFITNGGHVIWIAESYDTYPLSGSGTPPGCSSDARVTSLLDKHNNPLQEDF